MGKKLLCNTTIDKSMIQDEETQRDGALMALHLFQYITNASNDDV